MISSRVASGSTRARKMRQTKGRASGAEFWLNPQSLYELRIAQKRVGKQIKALPKLKRLDRVPA